MYLLDLQIHDFYEFVEGGVNKTKYSDGIPPGYQTLKRDINVNLKSKIYVDLIAKCSLKDFISIHFVNINVKCLFV